MFILNGYSKRYYNKKKKKKQQIKNQISFLVLCLLLATSYRQTASQHS